MKDKRSGRAAAGIGIGGVSILAVFVILCLTTFAALSLTSARADLKFTEKTAASSRAFYAADTAAERRLAALVETAKEKGLDEIMKEDGYTAERQEGGVLVGFTEPVDGTRELRVQVLLALSADGTPTGGWKRILWQTQALPYPEAKQETNLLTMD